MANVQLDLAKVPPEANRVGTQEEADPPAADPSHTGIVTQPAYESAALHEQLLIMKKEIDLLQVEVAKPAKPWWRQMSVVVSVAALLVGLVTTIYTQRQVHASEVRQARADFRELFAAIDDANSQLREIDVKYSNDPEGLQIAKDGLYMRRTILVEQAVDVLDAIGDEVTAAEYYGMGVAIREINATDPRVIELYKSALAEEMDVITRIALQQSLGVSYFASRDVTSGRRAFEAAIDAAGDDDYQSGNTHLWWASSELSTGNCEAAQKHFQLGSSALDRAATEFHLASDSVAARTQMQSSLEQHC